MLNVSSSAACALSDLVVRCWAACICCFSTLRISHRLNSILERNVAHGMHCGALLMRQVWKGRFVISSLLQVKVELRGAIGEWKIDKSCLRCGQSLLWGWIKVREVVKFN